MDVKDFLLRDYDLKVNYLSSHFSRMWPRFNFFLTLESGLMAFLVVPSRESWAVMAYPFCMLGVLVSVIWWFFGIDDRALVQVYREAIRAAAVRLERVLPELGKLGYSSSADFVGEADQASERLGLGSFHPFGWRPKWISVTRLTAVVPLVAMALWSLASLVVPMPREPAGLTGILVYRGITGIVLGSAIVLLLWGFTRTKEELGRRRAAPDGAGS